MASSKVEKRAVAAVDSAAEPGTPPRLLVVYSVAMRPYSICRINTRGQLAGPLPGPRRRLSKLMAVQDTI